MNIITRLSDSYKVSKDRIGVEKIDQKINKIEAKYSEAQNHSQAAHFQISSN